MYDKAKISDGEMISDKNIPLNGSFLIKIIV